MTGVITRWFVILNYAECALWVVIAICCAVFWRNHRLPDLLIAAFAFLLFGISDAIEVQTGAWWRPWWLFALKAVCVGTFAVLLYRYWRRK